MGSWSTKPFGNDTACDWALELEKTADSSLIDDLIGKYEKIPKEFDSPECEEFIAASALVASSAANPLKGISLELKQWVRERGYSPNPETIRKAEKGLKLIIEDSELLQIWQESDNHTSWLKSVTNLIDALTSIDPSAIPQRSPKKRPIPRKLDKLCEHPDLFTNPKIREKIQSQLRSLPNVNTLPNDCLSKHTPIALMCKHQLFDEADILIEMGAEVNEQEIGSPYRSLAYACLHNNHKLISRMLELGAKVNEEIWSTNYETGEKVKHNISRVFFSVLQCADRKTIEILIENELDVFTTDLNGETALHKSASAGNLESSKYLVELGLDVNAEKKYESYTPLTLAVYERHLEIVEFLIDSGADVNVCNSVSAGGITQTSSILDIVAREEGSDLYRILKRNGAKKSDDL